MSFVGGSALSKTKQNKTKSLLKRDSVPGKMISSKFLRSISIMPIVPFGSRNLFVAPACQAARKGTRMKREAKKKANKKEVVKKVFIPYQKRLEMEKVGKLTPRVDDSSREWPVDDVYFIDNYRFQIHTVEEAILKHRETLHPTIFNRPNADVIAHIELSMAANKKNQYMDQFSNILILPHQYEFQHQRTILAIGKDEEMVESIRNLNVTLAIGPEVVRMAEKGTIDFKMYEHIVCHSSLLPDLISIRGLLKKKYPSPRTGTAGVDLTSIVTRFDKGVEYKVEKDKYDFDFGKVDVKIGTLEMDPAKIEENLKTIINDIENSKPATRSKRAITLVKLNAGGTTESFKIDHNQYLPSQENEEEDEKSSRKMKA